MNCLESEIPQTGEAGRGGGRLRARARAGWVGALLILLLGAAALRLRGLDWDNGIGAHPDERHLVGVAEGLTWPARLNPFEVDLSFPYGHLPLYLLAVIGGPDRLLVARALAGLVDTGTVALSVGLGCVVGGRRGGLLAGALVAVMPLHVQQAHFGTADSLLVFLANGSLFFAVQLARTGRREAACLAGGSAGLATGCKAQAVLLALPLAVACSIRPGAVRERAGRGLVLGGTAVAAFLSTNPYALLEAPHFLRALAAQGTLLRGSFVAPYTLQYHGTLPYLYPVAQELMWGMGPVLGLVGWAGLGFALWRALRDRLAPAEWVLLAWALPFFALVGGLYVKLPRYLLPLTPVLAVWGAQVMTAHRRWAPVLALLALLPAGFLSTALVISYGQPHPWMAASQWIKAHLQAGSVIAVEAWDHPLPVGSTSYELRVLPIFDADTPAKQRTMERLLDQADAVVIASRRGYGAIRAWPQRYPQTASYYEALLEGRYSFTVCACFGRWPRLAGLALADDPLYAAVLPLRHTDCRPAGRVLWLPRLDESFVVYDHPLTVVLCR